MDIGLDVESPERTCSDNNCPFHGHLKVRGQILTGKVVGDRMSNTVVVEKIYQRYLRKFERYEKRRGKYLAHNPSCISASVGEEVKIIECRPISKAKTFVVVEKLNPLEAGKKKSKPIEKKAEKPLKEEKKPATKKAPAEKKTQTKKASTKAKAKTPQKVKAK
ncbi:MAG: 30S ribosomal protein S17 [Desulfatiglandales bacterium]